MHNIRECKVVLTSSNIDESSATTPKRKLLANIKKGSVRSNVAWIPANSIKTDKAAKVAKRHVVISTVNKIPPKKGL